VLLVAEKRTAVLAQKLDINWDFIKKYGIIQSPVSSPVRRTIVRGFTTNTPFRIRKADGSHHEVLFKIIYLN
jgi:hypothetical protein